MDTLTNALAWLKANPELTSALFVLALNVANGLVKSASERTSAVGRFFLALLDHFSVTVNSDASGTFKLPMKRSKPAGLRVVPPSPASPVGKNRAGKKLAMLLAGVAAFNSGCACWGEKANTKACVILKQVIDCSVGIGKDVVAHLVPTIVTLVSGGGANFDSVLAALQAGGFEDVGCVMAAIEKDLALSKSPHAKKFVARAATYRGARKYRLGGQVYPK